MSSRLSDKVEGICRNIEANDNSWSVRLNELMTLQKLVASTKRNPDVWKVNILQRLSKPLASQVQDLRSSIVREACKAIQIFARCLRDVFRPLGKTILPVLMEALGCGNKVISGYVDKCCVALVENVALKSAFSLLSELVRTSRSKLLRERSIAYMLVMLETWPVHDLQRMDEHVFSALKMGLSDASAETRAVARKCFSAFADHFPDRGNALLRYVDPRTQRLLMEESQTRKRNESRASSTPQNRTRRGLSRELNVEVPPPGSVRRSPKYSPIRASATSISSIDSSSSSVGGVNGFRVSEGEPVLVNTRFGDCIGVVRYCGKSVEFADGEWIGVEFDEPVGKNDGSVQGIQYFRCRADHGLFVRPSQMRPYFKRTLSSGSSPSSTRGAGDYDSKRIDATLRAAPKHGVMESAGRRLPPPESSSGRGSSSYVSASSESTNRRATRAQSRNAEPKRIPPARLEYQRIINADDRKTTTMKTAHPSVEFDRTKLHRHMQTSRRDERPYGEGGKVVSFSSPSSSSRNGGRPIASVDYLELGQDMLETHRAHIDDILEALKVEMEELAKFEDRLNQCRAQNRRLVGSSFHSYVSTISRRLGKRQTHHVILNQKLEDCQAILERDVM